MNNDHPQKNDREINWNLFFGCVIKKELEIRLPSVEAV